MLIIYIQVYVNIHFNYYRNDGSTVIIGEVSSASPILMEVYCETEIKLIQLSLRNFQ